MNKILAFCLVTSITLLTGCNSPFGSNPAQTYTVGGTTSGLAGDGLVLQNNGGDDLPVAGVTFEFETLLLNGGSYAVTVLAQPTGQSCDLGNGSGTISAANVTDVLVTCRGWGTAELVETDTSRALSPEIGVDDAGNAIAVWKQRNGGKGFFSIYGNRYTAGSGWGTAVLLETDDTGAVAAQRLAVDAAGNAIAVWEQQTSTTKNFNIYSNRYTAGSGWGGAEPVGSADSGNANDPQIATDAAGDAIAVWSESDGATVNIMSNRYIAGSGWGATAVPIDTDPGQAVTPQISVDATGNAIAVWQQRDGANFNIMSNYYTAGSGWGMTAELIETEDGIARTPQISFDESGNALAIWEQDVGANKNIWSNRYTAGSGWGTAELIENDNTGDASEPQIAADAAGNATVVWSQSGGARVNIMSNHYTAGSGWGTAELIENDDTGDAATPQIAADAAGNATAVWSQFEAASVDSIWSNRFE